ncbi:hypothetical protein SAMN04489731_12283, partial [Amycolatopsis regifaucium]
MVCEPQAVPTPSPRRDALGHVIGSDESLISECLAMHG